MHQLHMTLTPVLGSPHSPSVCPSLSLQRAGRRTRRRGKGEAQGHRCGANKREVTEKHKDAKWSRRGSGADTEEEEEGGGSQQRGREQVLSTDRD